MFEALIAPASLAAGRALVLSAMPDAPVVVERPRPTRWARRLRRSEQAR